MRKLPDTIAARPSKLFLKQNHIRTIRVHPEKTGSELNTGRREHNPPAVKDLALGAECFR